MIKMTGQPLTSRERQVCRLLCDSKSLRQIATELHISYHTVRSHVEAAKEKLGVTKVAALTVAWFQKYELPKMMTS